ncbi:uncharacterized protein MYCFIDRAFT_198487 [Pseudocercospora fijiensis CIRAD86]|uniref:Uncharacterized protein n=1 Tax=Pseudocercospora fijiensis (strain CIRAD86) TaxID=383855 RepID=M3AST4_PSEFD|nr:uncharacterized protein MYCFIDRAFT_198487 [Pseudocercospora fijiensis CIRAD86]EME80193.1 hypothetical protein MYCFIDRAFT_198487 [Pseudocercospora fijiensis CIRAD86]
MHKVIDWEHGGDQRLIRALCKLLNSKYTVIAQAFYEKEQKCTEAEIKVVKRRIQKLTGGDASMKGFRVRKQKTKKRESLKSESEENGVQTPPTPSPDESFTRAKRACRASMVKYEFDGSEDEQGPL